MPSLKQLRCEIEWGNTKTPFPEYGTTYGDGVVETYIAIPDHPQPFAVHLTSKSYIAEGLAMFVFMDGDYQCNRNRLNLKPPAPGTPRNFTEVDFRVRQKEKPLGDGSYLGRGWRFDKHNIVPLENFPTNVDTQHFNDLGQIAVIVLRCRAKDDIKSQSPASSNADDALLTPETEDETPTGDTQSSPSDHQEGHEAEPNGLLGIFNDGAADVHHFGLDGEGPGPEWTGWSWNPSYPSSSAGPGQPNGPVPGQPHPAHALPYGNYRYPSNPVQSSQPPPAMNQDRLENLRPQRHVHFNDQIPPQQSVYGASNQGYGGQHPNPNMGQSQSRLNPQQPGNYPNAQPIPHPNHRPPQQSNNYGNTAINAYHNQVQSHAPVPNGYTNPYSGVPPAQDYSRGFSLVPDYGYQPPVPSYPPTTYGASGYSGWPPGEGYASYAQSSWPQGYMPAPTYLASPNFAPWYQASYPYPYPQPSFPNDPLPPAPPNNEHSCGVAGNLPPGTPKPKPLDPAKEENNQNEAQDDQNQEDTSNENNESARNADGQSNANDDSQGWSNDDGNQTQAGESDWNTANTGGGQNDNWDTTATPTAAATSDWTHTPASTAQTNDAASSWNASADASAQAPGTLNNAPNLTQQGPATFAYPQAFQQSVQQPGTQPAPPPPLPSAASTHSRPLYGPHGTYYSTYHSSTLRGPRPDAAEEPPYDVPAGTLTTHQVKPGEGYMYVHKRRSPDYLDSLDEPYARFVFKYRTKEQIETETGIKIEDEPTGDEEKRKLQDLNKDDIIEMLLRAKTALAGRVPSPNPDGSTSGNNTAEPAAIPAPARSFLSYNVPPARSVSTSTISASTTNVGLGLSIPAPAANSSQGNNYAASIAASANNAQNWEPGSHYTTSAAQQQAAPYGWVLAPVSPTQQQQQQPQLQTQQQPQQQTDAWGTSIRPPPPPPPSTQAQQQQQTSSQPPSIQPIQPIQTDPTIHTYKSGGSSTLSTSTPAPTVVGASDRPVTSQGRWNQAAGAGSVAGGGGAPVQPDGGW